LPRNSVMILEWNAKSVRYTFRWSSIINMQLRGYEYTRQLARLPKLDNEP
jgi:hypothetical protein